MANVQTFLEQARSLQISLVLANQSPVALGSDMRSSLEANVGIIQAFHIRALEDVERFSASSGETIDVDCAVTENDNGSSISCREVRLPRLSKNDIYRIDTHPNLNMLSINCAHNGIAQYAGVPVIAEMTWHISKEDADDRAREDIPSGPGTFVPNDHSGPNSASSPSRLTKPSGGPDSEIVEAELVEDDGPSPLEVLMKNTGPKKS